MGIMPEKDDVMFLAIGFITTLFIMKSVRILRPSSAHDMSSIQTMKSGCASCNGR